MKNRVISCCLFGVLMFAVGAFRENEYKEADIDKKSYATQVKYVLIAIPNSTHGLQFDNPKKLNKTALNFIEKN